MKLKNTAAIVSLENLFPRHSKKLTADKFLATIYNTIYQNIPMQSAMDIPADQFPDSNEYGLVSYVKTALWMYILESSVGRDTLDLAVQHYFKKWRHKHPGPADMQQAFEDAINQDLDFFFELTKKEGKFQGKIEGNSGSRTP